MVARLLLLYVRVLFLLEVVLFLFALCAHVTVLAGRRAAFSSYENMFFVGAIIIGVPSVAYLQNGLKWIAEIKKAPKWMWIVSLSFGIYALVLQLLQLFASLGVDMQPLILSSYPLAFDSICACILYTVLWSNPPNRPEFLRRSRKSVVGFAIALAVLSIGHFAHLH